MPTTTIRNKKKIVLYKYLCVRCDNLRAVTKQHISQYIHTYIYIYNKYTHRVKLIFIHVETRNNTQIKIGRRKIEYAITYWRIGIRRSDFGDSDERIESNKKEWKDNIYI